MAQVNAQPRPKGRGFFYTKKSLGLRINLLHKSQNETMKAMSNKIIIGNQNKDVFKSPARRISVTVDEAYAT